MTKSELLTWLEPYAADIEVLVSLDADGGLFEFEPRYVAGSEGTDDAGGDDALIALQLTAEAT